MAIYENNYDPDAPPPGSVYGEPPQGPPPPGSRYPEPGEPGYGYGGGGLSGPAPSLDNEPRKETPTPSPKEPPEPKATTFTPPEGATVTERDAKGNPTFYRKDGVDYYSPHSTMWELGFKTSKEYNEPNAQGIRPSVEDNPMAYAPFVAVGEKHITRKQAEELSSLKGGEFAKKAIRIGLIDEEEVRTIKRDSPKLYNTLVTKGFDAYRRAAQSQEFLDKQEQKKEKQAFETRLKKDSPELYRVYKEKGVEAYNKAIGADEKTYEAAKAKYDKQRMAIALFEPFKNKDGTYEITRYLKQNPKGEQKLIDAGFNREDVKVAAYNAKLNTAQRLWQAATPWEEAKGEKATPKGVSIMAAEQLVPGVYTARHWKDLSSGEKSFSIGLDVLTTALIVVPVASAAARGARTVATAGRLARLAGAAKGVGLEAAAIARAPVDVIIHPIGTAKATGSQIRNLVETIANPRKLPEAVIATSDGFVMFKVTKDTTPAEAKAMGDRLAKLAAQRGVKPVVKIGDQVIELTKSPLMKEAGGLAHVTPDLAPFEKGTMVKSVKGKPLNEQGWFLAPEPATSLTQGGASGAGVIPKPATASGGVIEIAKYKPADLVRLDKLPIKAINLADAKSVPTKLADPLKQYIRKNDIAVWGSFDEWVKVKGAMRPNDLDLVVRDNQKAQAIKDVVRITEANGIKARAVEKGVDIYRDGEWQRLLEFRKESGHAGLLPSGLATRATHRIEGIRFGNLGEQYLLQSYGSVAKDAKAAVRAQKLAKAASDIKALLQASGAVKRIPGVFIISPETAKKAVSTEKLFYDYTASGQKLGWVREIERKFGVGTPIPKPAQKLFTRLGPTSERAEIWLEKPLTARQIVRLKAEGLIETLKQPFKPAITISRKGRIAALTEAETKKLAKILKASGNIDQAENLLMAGRLVRAARVMPLPLSRFTGRVSTQSRVKALERLRPSMGLAIPERISARKRVERTPARDERMERITSPVSQDRISIRDEKTGRFRRETPAERDKRVARIERTERATGRVETSRAPAPRVTTARTEPPRTTPTRVTPPRVTPPRVSPPRVVPPKGPPLYPIEGVGSKKEWTTKEIRSAIAWKDGFVIHALKSPYRRGIDEKTYSIKNKPEGLEVFDVKGRGSQQASARVTGKLPAKLTVDVGNQDVIISRGRGNRVQMRHVRDTGGTMSQLTVSRGHSISKKRGRVFHTDAGGGTIISRRPIKGY